MKIRFKSFCPPYVRGDVIDAAPEVAKMYIDAGGAEPVDPVVSAPRPKVEAPPVEVSEPEKAPVRRGRGRPRKDPIAPVKAGE